MISSDTRQLAARLEHHRSGNGSCLMAAVTAAGIAWSVVRTWRKADRNFERRLHNQKNSPARLCPVCRADRKTRQAAMTAVASAPLLVLETVEAVEELGQ